MLVEEVMSTPVVCCEAEATLQRVAEQMVRERVGSVIVTRAGDPAGIVTETDLIRAGQRTGRPFSEIPVSEAMSSPLVTVESDRTLRRATERMAEAGVKKLPVSSGLDLVGVLTLTDVVYHYSDLKREIHGLVRREFEEF